MKKLYTHPAKSRLLSISSSILITLTSGFFSVKAQQTSASFDSVFATKFQNVLDSVSNALSIRGASMALMAISSSTMMREEK